MMRNPVTVKWLGSEADKPQVDGAHSTWDQFRYKAYLRGNLSYLLPQT